MPKLRSANEDPMLTKSKTASELPNLELPYTASAAPTRAARPPRRRFRVVRAAVHRGGEQAVARGARPVFPCPESRCISYVLRRPGARSALGNSWSQKDLFPDVFRSPWRAKRTGNLLPQKSLFTYVLSIYVCHLFLHLLYECCSLCL